MAGSRRQRNIELITAALLSLGGAATTYCSFQASVWGGRQAASYSRADMARTEAAKFSAEAGQIALVDVTTFLAWLQADQHHEERLALTIRQRLRRNFRPVFEHWLAMDPLHNPDAPTTPFALPEYRLAERDQAVKLDIEADDDFTKGRYANAQTDLYLLATVVFAMSLFFAGIGHQFERLGVQILMLAASALMLTFGIYRLASLPHATPEPAPPTPVQTETRTS